MVEAVDRRGYARTTLAELVALAGVSKSTFYRHFDSKEACFLATFDEIVRVTMDRVAASYQATDGFAEQLRAALRTFMETVAEQPAAASLATVESLTLGTVGVDHRIRASREFEAMVLASFAAAPQGRPISELEARTIVAGVRGVTYRRLREGRADLLPDLTDELVDWALCFRKPPSPAIAEAIEAARAPRPQPPAPPTGEDEPPDWDEPPDSPRSRRNLTQRERIVRATASLSAAHGYAALSIPTISTVAGVSNQTFYVNFEGKQDAFLTAFEQVAAGALESSASAFASEAGRPGAVGAGLRALLEYIAAHPPFARLAFFELPTAGPIALDRADSTLDNFTAFLGPGVLPPALGGPITPVLREAVASGIWAVIQQEIVVGRRAGLPDLAPEITAAALAAFNDG